MPRLATTAVIADDEQYAPADSRGARMRNSATVELTPLQL